MAGPESVPEPPPREAEGASHYVNREAPRDLNVAVWLAPVCYSFKQRVATASPATGTLR